MTGSYEFGGFRLDVKGHMLFRGRAPVALPPKAVDTLLILVENAGSVVDKVELLNRVWKDAFVEEGSLTRTISLLRKALNEGEQEYIATVSKRGYRFAAQVSKAAEQPASPQGRSLLVVLPFENLSGDGTQEYFNDGLTEEMITQLRRLNPDGLGVIARTSAMSHMQILAGHSWHEIWKVNFVLSTAGCDQEVEQDSFRNLLFAFRPQELAH